MSAYNRRRNLFGSGISRNSGRLTALHDNEVLLPSRANLLCIRTDCKFRLGIITEVYHTNGIKLLILL